MDMTNTKLADDSFDIILSNHVLEHVEDDQSALEESLRLVGSTGFVHICVPSPAYWPYTNDWGFADKTKAYHFRHYGGDMGRNLTKKVPNTKCISIIGRDEVTDANDAIFFFAKTEAPLQSIAKQMMGSKFVCVTIT